MQKIGKKIISFFLMLSIVSAFAVPVLADEAPSGYEASEDTTAFAIYDESEKSLSFYCDTTVPSKNSTYDGKYITNVYTGFDSDSYNPSHWSYQPWYSVRENIYSVYIDNSFKSAQPYSMKYWFSYLTNCTEFIGLSNIDTSKVTTMWCTFWNCESVESLDISGWDTSNLEVFEETFEDDYALKEIKGLSDLNTSKVTNMISTFGHCESITSLDLSRWDTSNVTSFQDTFMYCTALTSLDLYGWDTSSATSMHGMFEGCSNLNYVGLSSFDTTSVTTMAYMFEDCTSLVKLNLTSFSTPNLGNINRLFYNCSCLESIYTTDSFTVDSVSSNGDNVFYGCASLTGGNGTEFNSKNVDYTMAHIDTEDNPGYFTEHDEHTYIVNYNWDGTSSCTATFTCSTCSDIKNVGCTISSKTITSATCGKDGEAEYTATCTFNGTTYNGTKDAIIPATGDHVYTFNEDDSTNYKISLSEGWMQFILTCSVCGDTYTSDKIDLIFEEYDEYNGQSGITYCTAKITVGGKEYEFRKNINEVSAQAQQEMEAHTWVQKTASTATCTDAGIIAYDCSSCGATKEVVDPAKGHTWDTDNADWDWSNNYSACTLTAKCLACGEEETHDCDVVASTSGSTILHTATATMSDGQVLQDTKTTKASAQSNGSSSSSTGDNTSSDNNGNSGSNATITNTNSTASNTTNSDTTSNEGNSVSTAESTAASSDGKDTGTTTSEGAKTGDNVIKIAALAIIALTVAAATVITRRHRTDDAV